MLHRVLFVDVFRSFTMGGLLLIACNVTMVMEEVQVLNKLGKDNFLSSSH